jgi:hypothetical protein
MTFRLEESQLHVMRKGFGGQESFSSRIEKALLNL